MANPSKQKGTSFETLVTNFLKTHGFHRAYRPALTGSGDVGDVNGVGRNIDDTVTGFKHVIFQCKNYKKYSLGPWMKATKEQAFRKGDDTVPILVVKRHGMGASNVGKNFLIMELEDGLDLLREAGYS